MDKSPKKRDQFDFKSQIDWQFGKCSRKLHTSQMICGVHPVDSRSLVGRTALSFGTKLIDIYPKKQRIRILCSHIVFHFFFSFTPLSVTIASWRRTKKTHAEPPHTVTAFVYKQRSKKKMFKVQYDGVRQASEWVNSHKHQHAHTQPTQSNVYSVCKADKEVCIHKREHTEHTFFSRWCLVPIRAHMDQMWL